MTTVYLAGKMTSLTKEEMSLWRDIAVDYLIHHKFKVLNPVATDLGTEPTARRIVGNNKYQIRNSDVVLAELDHADVSLGTVCEIVFASNIGRPVIAWGKADNIINHPWIQEHIEAHFESLDTALAYIVWNYRKQGAK